MQAIPAASDASSIASGGKDGIVLLLPRGKEDANLAVAQEKDRAIGRSGEQSVELAVLAAGRREP